jgi:hypothetical protein
MHRDLALAGMLAQQVEQKSVIRRTTEYDLAIVATLNNVVRIAGKAEAGETGLPDLPNWPRRPGRGASTDRPSEARMRSEERRVGKDCV